jgi:hypothetical protein
MEGAMVHLRDLIIAAYALLVSASTHPVPSATRHYAANGNFDAKGRYVPGEFGFNISDISKIRDLDRLPDGVLGFVWVGRCTGVDASFIATVRPFLNHPKVFGFYLMDDPDPAPWRGRRCPAEHLKAEADWIRSRAPNAKTFIMLMNLGSSRAPSFLNSYNPENTHVDLFGLSPYPCRSELGGCDFEMIDRFVDAAVAAGIPADRIVPAYQTFGGGSWIDDGGGTYVIPSDRSETKILARWSALIRRPVFDYAYSWGSQRGDETLANSPGLRAVLAKHNGVAGNCPPDPLVPCDTAASP